MFSWLASCIFCTKKILYLCGMVKNNAFPQPLDKDEELKYLKLFAEGDFEARNKLIEHNLRLVAHVAKKFDNVDEGIDDLVSIGTIGLIKGIESYNLEKGVKLSTYIARCIENEILMHFRYGRKTKKDVSLHDPITLDKEGNEILFIDVIGTTQDAISESIEDKFEKTQMHEFIEDLDEREREVVCWRFGILNQKEKTQRQIARDLGISRSYVSRIEKRALIKLFHRFYSQEKNSAQWSN